MHSNMWHSLCNEVPSMQPGKVSSSVQGDLFPLSRGRTGRTCPSPQSLQEYSVTPGSCNSFPTLRLCYMAWNPLLARLLSWSFPSLAWEVDLLGRIPDFHLLFTFDFTLTWWMIDKKVCLLWLMQRTCLQLVQYIEFLVFNVMTAGRKIL